MTKNDLPTIGFVGTGAIATAIVTGFCRRAAEHPYPIVVSPRSKANADMLKASFPDRVTVAQSMQEVVDRSDWVVLAVLPEVGEEVCSSLHFRPEHKVINLLTDKTLPQVRSWIGETAALLHMIPLTFNAFCNGPIVLSPPHDEAAEIFGHIGDVIQTENRYHAAVFSAITGCVAPFYSLMDSLIDWAREEGVPGDAAASYVTRFFKAVCEEAVNCSEEEIHTMATVSTPGGINHMVRRFIHEEDGFDLWAKAMQPAIARLAENIPH